MATEPRPDAGSSRLESVGLTGESQVGRRGSCGPHRDGAGGLFLPVTWVALGGARARLWCFLCLGLGRAVGRVQSVMLGRVPAPGSLRGRGRCLRCRRTTPCAAWRPHPEGGGRGRRAPGRAAGKPRATAWEGRGRAPVSFPSRPSRPGHPCLPRSLALSPAAGFLEGKAAVPADHMWREALGT